MIKQIILKIQQKDKRQKWRLSTFWEAPRGLFFLCDEKYKKILDKLKN